jgi:hypothetical protein
MLDQDVNLRADNTANPSPDASADVRFCSTQTNRVLRTEDDQIRDVHRGGLLLRLL